MVKPYNPKVPRRPGWLLAELLRKEMERLKSIELALSSSDKAEKLAEEIKAYEKFQHRLRAFASTPQARQISLMIESEKERRILTSYEAANLMHEILTDIAVEGKFSKKLAGIYHSRKHAVAISPNHGQMAMVIRPKNKKQKKK